jgi:intein/homing endonuclease
MDKVNEEYWYNQWHLDTETHKKLHIRNVTKIDKSEPVSIYGDSVDGKTIIKTDMGDFTIENLYNLQNKNSIRKDKEVIPVNFKSLNWTEENGIHYSKVKNIIRHKTSKKKFKIKAGDKEVIVTEDHSIMVFREGEKIEVKPNEIKNGDKVLIYK